MGYFDERDKIYCSQFFTYLLFRFVDTFMIFMILIQKI